MSILRTIAMFIYLFGYMILHYGILRRAERAAAAGDTAAVEQIVNQHIPRWSRGILKVTGVSLTVDGLENIPKDRPCVFVANHRSYYDIPLLLAGLEKPTSGKVYIGKHGISKMTENELAEFRQQHLGFIFQSYNLLPTMTAAENVALPLMFKGIDPDVRLLEAKKMLCRVGLKDRMDHFPNQMSGGQQQRVGIARAFVTHPEVVFADEPTGNLDSKTTKEVMHMIRGFAKRFHQTIVLVSHDPEMTEYADRIVTLIDGRIVSNVENQVKAEIDAAPYIE